MLYGLYYDMKHLGFIYLFWVLKIRLDFLKVMYSIRFINYIMLFQYICIICTV